MDRLLELDRIFLQPSQNSGHIVNPDFGIIAEGNQKYLPIFVSPMESVCGFRSAKNYYEHGIRPVIPLTVPIENRLNWCQGLFCAFTMEECERYLLSDYRRFSNVPGIMVCIDAGNGNDTNLLVLGQKLKKIFGYKISLMGGNLGSPEVYGDFCRAGFDYVRVGMTSGSLVDIEKYGFHYPMASFLEQIRIIKKTSLQAITRFPKVIADGGIDSIGSIIKALALGADYVMCGSLFASILEAEGPIIMRSNDKQGAKHSDSIDPATVKGMEGYKAKLNGYTRNYYGNTSPIIRAKLGGYSSLDEYLKTSTTKKVQDAGHRVIEIDQNLDEFITEFTHAATYAFEMTGSRNWQSFKERVKYAECL